MKIKGVVKDCGERWIDRNGNISTLLYVKISENKYGRYYIRDRETFDIFWINKDILFNVPIYFTCDENNNNVKFSNYFIRKNKLKKVW